jgi:hypothetical protein
MLEECDDPEFLEKLKNQIIEDIEESYKYMIDSYRDDDRLIIFRNWIDNTFNPKIGLFLDL